MDEPSDDTRTPAEARPRTALTLLRDVLIGGDGGLLLAVAWLLVIAAGGPSWPRLKEVLLFLGVFALVLIGLFAGFALGGEVGLVVGAIAGYLVPFIAYGIRVQATTGWKAWLSDRKQEDR